VSRKDQQPQSSLYPSVVYCSEHSFLQSYPVYSVPPCVPSTAEPFPNRLYFPPEAVEQAGVEGTNSLCPNEAFNALHECIVASSGGKKRMMFGKLEHSDQSKLGIDEQVLTCSTWRQGSGMLGISNRRREEAETKMMKKKQMHRGSDVCENDLIFKL
jgi:hypothetical protein